MNNKSKAYNHDYDANLLGERNQDYDLEAWESGEEEKERAIIEGMFGKE